MRPVTWSMAWRPWPLTTRSPGHALFVRFADVLHVLLDGALPLRQRGAIADAAGKSDACRQEIKTLGRCRMKRSTERFLTTHTGSLPRPDDLLRMMYAKEEGVPVDRAALAARVRDAVAEVVKRQIEAGIDLLGDGELS